MFLHYTATMLCIILCIHALPVTFTSNRESKLQAVLYTEKTRLYDLGQQENWFMSQEYDIFSSITDYYENMVDTTLNSESENLLIDLVHLPQESKTKILINQAHLIGIESLSDKQMIKMPSIIGKHVQKMNDQVYQSIENIITLYWHTIWDPRLLAKKDGQEEHILSFLSGFNGIVAKKLMDKIDEYDLIGEIKADIISSSSAFIKTVSEEEDDEEEISLFSWLNNSMMDLFTSATHALSRSSATGSLSSKSKLATNLETDFLREYLSDIRTSLLMELHIQFMDFFTRIQTDIVDQLSIYYDEEL